MLLSLLNSSLGEEFSFYIIVGMSRFTKAKKCAIVSQSVGQVFGKLVVVKFAGYRRTPRGKAVPYVECHCECGKTKTISLWDLRSKKTRSCGLDHPYYADRSMPAFNQVYNHAYRLRATARGLAFKIAADTFRELTQKPCHYCGSSPSKSGAMRREYTTVARLKTGNGISEYRYNGLDRINNSIGYVVSNVVPCCKVCNHAKHTLGYDDFLEWVDRVAAFKPQRPAKPEERPAASRAKRVLRRVTPQR